MCMEASVSCLLSTRLICCGILIFNGCITSRTLRTRLSFQSKENEKKKEKRNVQLRDKEIFMILSGRNTSNIPQLYQIIIHINFCYTLPHAVCVSNIYIYIL